MQQGEKFQCTNEECACEITVVTASQAEDVEEQSFICVCGEEMEPAESKARSGSGRSGGGKTPR
jgi:hypothetical protein